ncbi:MAG: 3-methyl-2-oxobutanoate dehydrogenase subunit VorB [Candidatus Omnitrophica bacterium]|nr:3-methyl-2-oxobutanoate dehydrogenase subunit VorB [Candidatus Omnitrophota bacterium]
MNKKMLMTGNEAIGEAAVQAGCDFYAGYPITPQNELTAYLAKRMPEEKRVFVQAESELAAINMVMGAAACGRRAMTTSSSPGISLKQEGISYLAGARLPCLIVNIMRGGPGLGNIAPAQSDYFQATKGGGHGDYHCLVLAPGSVQEAYHLVFLGFDLADQYRTPTILLGDGMLGQMMEPLIVCSSPACRPGREFVVRRKRLPTKPWALNGCQGRGPRVVKSFFMQNELLEGHNKILQKNYAQIKNKEQRCEQLYLEDSSIVLVAYGSMARIAKAATAALRKKKIKAGLLRPISLWPFPAGAFEQLLKKKKKLRFLVLEMSCGQMVEDVRLAVNGRAAVDFYGRSGGGIPTEEEILKKILHRG